LDPVDATGTKGLSNYIGVSSNFGTSLEGGNIGYTLSSFWNSLVNNYSGIFDGNSNNTQANGVRLYSSGSNGSLANNVVDAPLGDADSYITDATLDIPTSGKNFSTALGQFVVMKDAAMEFSGGIQRALPFIGGGIGLFLNSNQNSPNVDTINVNGNTAQVVIGQDTLYIRTK
jgi:hypothetical protein